MEQFKKIKKRKNKYSPSKICSQQNCLYLLEFAENVYKLEFEDKPDYAGLRWLLTKNLLEKSECPKGQFDWIEKMKNGSFDKMKDLMIQVVGIQEKSSLVKLSERILDLNLGHSFKEKLNEIPKSN